MSSVVRYPPFCSCAARSAESTAERCRPGGNFFTHPSISLRVCSLKSEDLDAAALMICGPILRDLPVSRGPLVSRGAPIARPGGSPIDLPEDDILRADDRHHVCDHMAAHHLVERGEMRESGRARLQAIGLVRTVGDEIDAELALRRLDRGIGLPFGHAVALREELEVMDQ